MKSRLLSGFKALADFMGSEQHGGHEERGDEVVEAVDKDRTQDLGSVDERSQHKYENGFDHAESARYLADDAAHEADQVDSKEQGVGEFRDGWKQQVENKGGCDQVHGRDDQLSGRDRQGGELEYLAAECDRCPDIAAQDEVGDAKQNEYPAQYLKILKRQVGFLGEPDRSPGKDHPAQRHEPEPQGYGTEAHHFSDIESADAVSGVDAIAYGSAYQQGRGDVVAESESEK